jgi:hypothetical protein
MKKKFKFGDRGIWHAPASIENKIPKRDLPCRVLEHNDDGTLYLFLDKPYRRGWKNLTHRTATCFESDFTPV